MCLFSLDSETTEHKTKQIQAADFIIKLIEAQPHNYMTGQIMVQLGCKLDSCISLPVVDVPAQVAEPLLPQHLLDMVDHPSSALIRAALQLEEESLSTRHLCLFLLVDVEFLQFSKQCKLRVD